jgi:hypothetical protein
VPRGILYVETRPATPEQAAAYHEWYDHTHVPEVCALDGFVSARRFVPADPDDPGPCIAIYELDAPDLIAARDRLNQALANGELDLKPVTLMDPPPVVRLFALHSSHPTAEASG